MRRELKGIWTTFIPPIEWMDHKAYPDEKGTERIIFKYCRAIHEHRITRRIPMRRELKVDDDLNRAIDRALLSQGVSR